MTCLSQVSRMSSMHNLGESHDPRHLNQPSHLGYDLPFRLQGVLASPRPEGLDDPEQVLWSIYHIRIEYGPNFIVPYWSLRSAHLDCCILISGLAKRHSFEL